MRFCRTEPTIDELLSDPMMEKLYQHGGTTADGVRVLMQEAAARLSATRARYGEEPSAGNRSRLCD